MESINLAGRVSAECQPLCVASRGVVPPLRGPPRPQDSRTPRPWGHPTWAGAGIGEVKWRIFYLILLRDCSEMAKTWGEAAHFTWNLLEMTKDSFSCMLATFQGLPRWF